MSKPRFYKNSKATRPTSTPEEEPKPTVDPKPVPPRPPKRQGINASKPRQINEDSFKPKHLSTSSSELKNDPHSRDAIIMDGYAGLVKSRPLDFKNDYSQFVTITRNLYAQIAKGSKPFKLNVSSAMFEYYANMLLWQRLYAVLGERQLDASIAEDLTQKLGKLLVPDELLRYFEGIGNIKDPEGRMAYLTLDAMPSTQTVNGMSGHYERVSADTHVSYETQPSPFVVAYRMCYEYCQYVEAGRQRDQELPESDEEEEDGADQPRGWHNSWDLPARLRPRNRNLVPNRNLLGWIPLNGGFSREMASVIERYVNVNADFTFNVVGIRNAHGLPIFIDVLEHVSQMLSVVKRGLEENNGRIIIGSGGSCSQVLFQERVSDDMGTEQTGNTLIPVAERELLTRSTNDVGHPLACAAAIFKYRIHRYNDDDNADCFAYTTGNGRIPDEWAHNENRVFLSQPRWNYPDLSGARVSGTQAAIDLIFKTRKVNRIGD